MTARRDTEAESRASVHAQSVGAFQYHVIEQMEPNRWKCAKPGSGRYSFQVVIVPGCVIVYGDVGDVMLRNNYSDTRETVEWLKGASRDYGYLCGKFLFKEAFRHFYPDDAADWARQIATERIAEAEPGSRRAQRMQDFLVGLEDAVAVGELRAHEWSQLSDLWLDGDGHGVGHGWSAGAFWAVECLAKFAVLYEQALVRA